MPSHLPIWLATHTLPHHPHFHHHVPFRLIATTSRLTRFSLRLVFPFSPLPSFLWWSSFPRLGSSPQAAASFPSANSWVSRPLRDIPRSLLCSLFSLTIPCPFAFLWIPQVFHFLCPCCSMPCLDSNVLPHASASLSTQCILSRLRITLSFELFSLYVLDVFPALPIPFHNPPLTLIHHHAPRPYDTPLGPFPEPHYVGSPVLLPTLLSGDSSLIIRCSLTLSPGCRSPPLLFIALSSGPFRPSFLIHYVTLYLTTDAKYVVQLHHLPTYMLPVCTTTTVLACSLSPSPLPPGGTQPKR